MRIGSHIRWTVSYHNYKEKKMQILAGRTLIVLLAILTFAPITKGLTIHQVQESNASLDWKSAYENQDVDVTGGVVTYADMPPGKAFYRVVIQDPTENQWAGVEVKIISGVLGTSVQVGDRVDLTSVRVDESSSTRGTTYLIFDPTTYGSGFTILSSGNAVSPTVVSPELLGGGDLSADPVNVEKYEGMLMQVQDVTVGLLNLGSHNDNYELISSGETCWASDYFNINRDSSELYHPWTAMGQYYTSVTGILEQYTKTSDGYDYYQLLSRSTSDMIVPEPASMLLLSGGMLWLAGRRKKRL